MKTILISLCLLLSSMAFANPAELVGKWTTECLPSQGSIPKFIISKLEFLSEKHGTLSTDSFSDSQCLSQTDIGGLYFTSIADANTVRIKMMIGTDIVVIMKFSYVISGDQMTMIPIHVLLNGNLQAPSNAIVYTRVP